MLRETEAQLRPDDAPVRPSPVDVVFDGKPQGVGLTCPAAGQRQLAGQLRRKIPQAGTVVQVVAAIQPLQNLRIAQVAQGLQVLSREPVLIEGTPQPPLERRRFDQGHVAGVPLRHRLRAVIGVVVVEEMDA